jgi:hypothetical protein
VIDPPPRSAPEVAMGRPDQHEGSGLCLPLRMGPFELSQVHYKWIPGTRPLFKSGWRGNLCVLQK